MKQIFLLLAFFACLVPIYCGKVRPDGAHSIVLTSTNAGDLADYNFTMTLDTELPAGGVIEITFPYNQYLAGLGLPSNFVVYAPYPTVITTTLDTTTATTLICQVGHRAANTSFTIGVLNVRNPSKTGGTGNFKVVSKIGNKILDVNYNFGVIGIYAVSSDLLSASIDFESGMSQLAGQMTSYILTLTPSVNLPALIDIKVIFPEVYNFTGIQTSQCGEYKKTLGLSLYCQTNSELPNVIIFRGFAQAIAQGTSINLILQNVTNPAQEMTTKALSYYVREVGTNNTIQKSTGVPGLYINPGSIYEVQLSNSNSYFPLYANLNRELLLSFRPSNAFNAIQIGTAFPMISSCTVVNGLSLKNQFDPIVCSASSGVMVIKGFKTYDPEDLYLKVVTIKFLATLPSTNIITNHIEIYTFTDEGYVNKVDQSTTADTTQAQIVSLTTTTSLATTTFTTTSTVPEAANTFTFAIRPAASYTNASKIVFELSKDFTGIPTCSYRLADPSPSTYAARTCTLSNGILTMTLYRNLNQPTTTPASVVISGLYNPTIPKTYYIRYYIYSNAGSIMEYYLATTTISSPTISSISMVPLANGINHNTIYALTFQTVSFLQDGYFLLSEPNKLSSYIDIIFNMQVSGSNSFTADLGSGLDDRSDFPCEIIGMKKSVFAQKFRCQLIKGPSTVSATSTVTVRVLDFNFVLTGTTLRINIPALNSQLSTGNPTATVKTYIVKDYTTYLTSSASVTLVSTSASLGTAATASSITIANSSVQATTTLNIGFSTTVAVTAGSNSSIQIEYPAGYTFSPSQVTVQLDGTAVAANKLHFAAAAYNFFTIELASNLASGAHTIQIANMQTPNASFTTGNTLYLRTTQSNVYVQAATFTMPTLTPGAFDLGVPAMSIFPNTYSHPYALYNFTMTTSKFIPSTASIVVTFPAGYSLDSYAECTSLLGLNASTAAGVQCTVTATKVTITNFKNISIGTDLEIAIFGVTSPATSISALSFIVSVLDTSSNTIETISLSSSLTGTFAAGDLNVIVGRLTPQNPVVDSTFLITVDPKFQLPKNSIMTVTFDSDFSVLYTETIDLIECIAQGGLYTISDCSVSGVVLTMTMGATSNASVPIDFHYFGLLRFPNANELLTGFSVTLTYKGSTIATASTFPSITTGNTVTLMNDITMDFYPRNEGEKANYVFTFTPATTLLDETMYFLIRFPSDYDPNLFKYDPVVESSQLTGALVGTVMSRQIIVTGFKSMTITGPITLRLWGVVNPNKVDISRTGTFSLALMQGDDVIEGNFAIPGIVPYLAPESIQFTSVTSTTYKSRYSSDFTFTFSSEKAIPASGLGGQVFVDFPPDYLIDSYGGECTINEDFSFFVNCYLDNNRVFVNASNTQWTETMGSLTLEVNSIRTTDDDGEALNFIIFNYDSSDKRILSRTYSTLNPASITYSYDGILISVNNDEPIDVEVGTYTDEITIQLPSPSLQTLTLTPNTLNSSITITPFPLQIQLGETQVTFRVAAPRDILLKSFYITWSKTGDSLVPTYANLRRTNLRMRSGLLKRVASYESMEYIPAGGITFPLFVSTPNPPYTELLVTLSILNGDTLATLSKSVLTFAKGDFKQSYNITVDLTHPLTNVQVFFTLGGYDGPSYVLSSDTLTIPIIAEETFLPVITDGQIVSNTRSSVTFNVTANTLSFIYFVIGYKNMPVPTFDDVSKKVNNITLSYSIPIFDEDYIKRSPKNITITVDDLSPGRDYEVYAYIMNLNQRHNPDYLKLSFSTNAPQKTAEFVMQIKQTLLPTDLKNEIISRLSQMISIEAARLIERTSNCYQTRDSLYFNAANSTYFHIYLLPDPTNENDNSAPISLVRNLNTRTDEIREFVPRLADGDLLQIQELSNDIPEFTVRPAYTSNEYYSLTMTVSVTHCGYIHAIAIPVNLSQNNTPTLATVYQSEAPITEPYPYSFEIYSGLDIQNQPAIYKKIRVNDFSKDYTLTVPVNIDNLIYHVYIATENDWPTYNLFLDDDAVARIEAKTIKKRKPLNVYSINDDNYATDTSSPRIQSMISLLALVLLAIFI